MGLLTSRDWHIRAMFVTASVAVACSFSTQAHAQQYNSAEDAFSAGAKLHNARRYAEAQAPLEAAIELSDDPLFKVKVYRALVQSYRQLPDIDHMLKATDYILENGESSVEKSLMARNLVGFVYQRGKVPDTVKIYEDQLKKDPNSKPALYTLVEMYQRASPNPKRQAELFTVLTEVQRKDEAALAEKLEKQATDDPRTAAASYKDAALAWIRAADQQKAAAALAAAETAGPDSRNDLLAHFWHKGMADAYMGLNQPKEAIPHFEKAIQKTNIAGYIKACQEQLAKAREAAGN